MNITELYEEELEWWAYAYGDDVAPDQETILRDAIAYAADGEPSIWHRVNRVARMGREIPTLRYIRSNPELWGKDKIGLPEARDIYKRYVSDETRHAIERQRSYDDNIGQLCYRFGVSDSYIDRNNGATKSKDRDQIREEIYTAYLALNREVG